MMRATSAMEISVAKFNELSKPGYSNLRSTSMMQPGVPISKRNMQRSDPIADCVNERLKAGNIFEKLNYVEAR